MDILSFLPLLSGLGLFLYGMHIMGGALEKIAGSRLERTLDKLTASRLRGVLLGTAVTAVIQSSSATTVMVVGFVNAGIMKLAQAVSVIMGANIGTTVTAQILRLGDIDASNPIMQLLKPSGFSHILLIIGAVMVVFTVKKKRRHDFGELLLGLGMLFFGMLTMESALTPLRELEGFRQAFASFSNPFIGILIGAGVTALIQSSSASIGILQALSTTGAVTFSSMVPIVLGQNIGTCITVILAAIGANKNAKRAAVVHLSFNIIGTLAFVIIIYAVQGIFGLPFWNDPVNMGTIANFHTLFNLGNTVWMLPLSGYLVKLANFVIKDDAEQGEENLLDDRFLGVPGVAMEQCRKLLSKMGGFVRENVRIACGMHVQYDPKARVQLDDNEDFCDKTESNLTSYLIKVSATDLSEQDNREATQMIPTLTDYERISDRAVNIAEVAEYNLRNSITFSEDGQRELDLITEAAEEILDITLTAYDSMDAVQAKRIEPLEEIIDSLTETLRERHVSRLQSGVCTTNAGISFIEILTNIERIADHCSNIGIRILQNVDKSVGEIERHEYLRKLHEGGSAEYDGYFRDYSDKYLLRLKQMSAR